MNAHLPLRLAWLAAGALALVLAWWVWASRAQAPLPSAAGPDRAAPPVPVVVAPAVGAADAQVVQAVGSALARRSATLQPAVAGEVASLHFKPGQRVKAGQPLLRLEDRQERLAADLAAARVSSARQRVERLAVTEGTGAVPASVIDDARNALRSAEIEHALAQETVAQRVVRAPFDGVVGLANVDPGDRVTPASVITELDDRRRVLVAFDLPETYLARVDAGHPVQVTSVAFPERVFEGRLTQLDNRVDAATRSLSVRAELSNEEDLLRPGMSLRVRLELAGATQLKVPDLALQWGREGGHVWVLRDGRSEQVPVRLVRRLEDAVLIDGALRAGEPVIVEGVQRLRPGREVQVVGPAP